MPFHLNGKRILKNDPCKLTIKGDKPLLLINKNKTINFDDVKSSKDVYMIFIDKYKKNPSSKHLWENIFEKKNVCWSNVYKEKVVNVKEQKIVAFNFKILNNILAQHHTNFISGN